MANCSQPADIKFMIEKAQDSKKAWVKMGIKGRAAGTHLRVLEDSINIFAWYQCPSNDADQFKEIFGDFFGNIDFNGSKLT